MPISKGLPGEGLAMNLIGEGLVLIGGMTAVGAAIPPRPHGRCRSDLHNPNKAVGMMGAGPKAIMAVGVIVGVKGEIVAGMIGNAARTAVAVMRTAQRLHHHHHGTIEHPPLGLMVWMLGDN